MNRIVKKHNKFLAWISFFSLFLLFVSTISPAIDGDQSEAGPTAINWQTDSQASINYGRIYFDFLNKKPRNILKNKEFNNDSQNVYTLLPAYLKYDN